MTIAFTEEQLQPVKDGVRKFIRLQGLIHDPSPLVWGKWLADESDAKAALESVAEAFRKTEPMLGKRKYVGVDFDPIKSVKTDLTSFLTTDVSGPSATLKKRNLPMYMLVVEPTIDLFATLSHRDMIDNADAIVQLVAKMIDGTDAYGTYDDALVARHQVSETLQMLEEARKEEAAKKSRRRRTRDPVAELFASLGLDKEEELEDDYV